MTLAEAKVGGWSLNEVLTSAQMNTLQAEMLKAIDGVGGGTYVLTDPLIFDGAGDDVQFEQRVRFLSGGELQLDPGSSFEQFSGSDALFDGSVEFSGSVLFNSFGVTLGIGSTFIVEGGASIEHGGLMRVDGGEIELLDIASITVDDQTIPAYRVIIAPAEIEEFNDEHTWSLTAGSSDGFFLQTSVSPPSGAQLWIPLRVEPGDELNTVTMTINGNAGGGGGHAGLPSTMPTIAIVANGTELDIATDASATLGAYENAHSVTVTHNDTVLDATYYLRINGEAGANALANHLKLLNIAASVTRRRLVSTEQL